MACIHLRRLALAGVAVIGLATAGSQAELVINGGFETGSFFPWMAPPVVLPPNPNPSFCWVSGGGGHSGERYARLSSTNFEYISQILPTNAGTDYELTFWLRRPINAPGALNIRWEGQFVFQEGILLPDNTNWWGFTVPLHANFTGSFLEIGQATFPAEFHIDDISVVQVPGPGGAALFTAAAGGLALRRRRR